MKEWLTPQQVGDLVGGLLGQFVRNEIRAGLLPAVYVRPRGRSRGTYRIRRADALAYEAQVIAPMMAVTTPVRGERAEARDDDSDRRARDEDERQRTRLNDKRL